MKGNQTLKNQPPDSKKSTTKVGKEKQWIKKCAPKIETIL